MSQPDSDSLSPVHSPPHDPLLELLLSASLGVRDKSDGVAEVAVTLQIGGLLVRGIVISAREFVQAHTVSDTVSEFLDQRAAAWRETFVADGRLKYIHLRNAHVLPPGQSAPEGEGSGMYWRGRIDRVDGFALGRTFCRAGGGIAGLSPTP